jgi:hypothetical protein
MTVAKMGRGRTMQHERNGGRACPFTGEVTTAILTGACKPPCIAFETDLYPTKQEILYLVLASEAVGPLRFHAYIAGLPQSYTFVT